MSFFFLFFDDIDVTVNIGPADSVAEDNNAYSIEAAFTPTQIESEFAQIEIDSMFEPTEIEEIT